MMDKKIITLTTLLIASIVGHFVLYSMWATAVTDNNSLEENIANIELSNNQLETQVSNLQTQMDSLETQVSDLEWENEELEWWKSYLENETTELKAANLDLIDTSWTDNHPWLGSPYVHVDGTVVNFGKETAYNVVVTVKIYEQAVLLKTEDISLEDIWGEWYGKFDVDIGYSGDATSVDRDLSWT